MSLRAFHIVFIICSMLVCIGLSLWGYLDYTATQSRMNLVIGIIAFLSTGSLVYYLFGMPHRYKS